LIFNIDHDQGNVVFLQQNIYRDGNGRDSGELSRVTCENFSPSLMPDPAAPFQPSPARAPIFKRVLQPDF